MDKTLPLVGIMVAIGIWPCWAAVENFAVLEAQLTQNQTKLIQLNGRVAALEAQVGVAAQQTQTAIRAMLKLQRYPPTLWAVQRLQQGGVGSEGLLAYTMQQQAQQLAALQRRYRTLFTLYGQAHVLQQQLAQTRQALAQQETPLQRRQRAELARLGRDASLVAQRLQAALSEAPHVAVPPSTTWLPMITWPQTASNTVVTAVPRPLPRQLPLRGRLIVKFRQGEGAEHEGVVLAASAKTSVRSPISGRVIFAEGFRQFGGLVIIADANGHTEMLGGLGSLQVAPGALITAGQPVGELGPRGRLYWEVRVHGLARNPLSGISLSLRYYKFYLS